MKSTIIYALLDLQQNVVQTKTGSFFETRAKAREARKETETAQNPLTLVRFEVPNTCWEKVR
jgi:hypothetical protein